MQLETAPIASDPASADLLAISAPAVHGHLESRRGRISTRRIIPIPITINALTAVGGITARALVLSIAIVIRHDSIGRERVVTIVVFPQDILVVVVFFFGCGCCCCRPL
jgi:hypothetical protein